MQVSSHHPETSHSPGLNPDADRELEILVEVIVCYQPKI